MSIQGECGRAEQEPLLGAGDLKDYAASSRHSVAILVHPGRDYFPYRRASLVPSCNELTLLLVGTVAALVNGLTPILFYYYFGELVGEMTDAGVEEENSEELARLAQTEIEKTSYRLGVVAAIAGVSAFLYSSLFSIAGEWIVQRIRRSCFNSVLLQEIAYFDHTEVGFLMARITEDGAAVRDLYSSSIGSICMGLSQLVAGLGYSLFLSWKLTLSMMLLAPFIGGVIAIDGWFSVRLNERVATASAKCMCIVEEVFSNVRIVHAFGQERKETERYRRSLGDLLSLRKKQAAVRGTSDGIMDFVIWGSCAVAFYVGSIMVGNGTLDFGSLVTIFGMMIFAILGLSQAFAEMGDLLDAITAYRRIRAIIDREPKVAANGGVTVPIRGDLSFRQVTFAYEGRENPALDAVSFSADAGQSLAFVGHSGGGKSTVISLLERFYDPQSGTITIDGRSIAEYDIRWLRSHMAIVTQEPILFSGTVLENIAYALDDASEDEVVAAAKAANAHEFILELPDGYSTTIGEGGVLLSGGQKQRLSIARALMCNPRILLLDEATSALDTASEKLVQEALERLMVGRTSVVIAHRLSTVRHASKIVVLDHGRVVEQGTHEELLDIDCGVYRNLAHSQRM